jgi:anti-sigma B factor antagonist
VSAMTAFNVYSSEKTPGVFIVYLEGSLDSNTYSLLEGKLEIVLQKNPHLVLFDLQQLAYISSMGIRVFIKASKEMKALGGSVRYANLQPHIRKVFDIVKVLPEEQIFTSIEELDAYLTAIQEKVRAGEMDT